MYRFGGNNNTRPIPAGSSINAPPPPNFPSKLNVENRSPDNNESDDDPITRQFTVSVLTASSFAAFKSRK